MPRKKTDKAVILKIKRLRSRGFTIDGILSEIEYGVSRKTAWKYIKEWDTAEPTIKALEVPFECQVLLVNAHCLFYILKS